MVFNFDVRAIWRLGLYGTEPIIARLRLPFHNVGF